MGKMEKANKLWAFALHKYFTYITIFTIKLSYNVDTTIPILLFKEKKTLFKKATKLKYLQISGFKSFIPEWTIFSLSWAEIFQTLFLFINPYYNFDLIKLRELHLEDKTHKILRSIHMSNDQ